MPWTIADVDRFKRGLTPAQKRRWVAVANSALRSCLADGGSNNTCEGSAIRQANGVVGNEASVLRHMVAVNENYTLRTQEVDGVKYLVAPVVMIREGVHNGSLGPILHLAEDLGHYPEAWNGIPVVVFHPQRNGEHVSANAPDLVRTVVGRVYNTHMEGDKLKAEVYLNEDKLREISPETLGILRSGRPLDVSVGVFNDEEYATEGATWNGEQYESIARNHRPDHLALLPGGQGACSWEDGCGIRVNESFEPPASGDAPQEVKSILRRVYNGCRTDWVSAHPNDRENAANKESCSRIAWSAVRRAGWRKQNDRWIKTNEEGGENVNVNEPLQVNALRYSGTESTAWSAPSLSDFGVDGNWEGLSASERSRVASHYLIGSGSAATFGDLKLPVVNPRTGKLSERALRAVIGGRGAQVSGVSAEQRSAARRRAYRLLNSEFDAGLTIPSNLEEMKLTNMDRLLDANQDQGYRQSVETVQRKLDRMDTGERVHYLEEMYDDYLIYRVHTRDSEMATPKFYRQSYSFNDQGAVQFTGEPTEVRKRVEYVTMEASTGLTRTKFSNNSKTKEVLTMSKDGKTPCCEDLVDKLIANERTKYVAEDKEWLMTLEENQLAKMVPEPEKKPAVNTTDGQPPQINAEQAMQVLKESVKTTDDFLGLIPDDELRDEMSSGLQLFRERKQTMVKEILANTDKWTEDELKSKEMGELTKVHGIVTNIVDYSVQGHTGRSREINDNDGPEGGGLYPAGVGVVAKPSSDKTDK